MNLLFMVHMGYVLGAVFWVLIGYALAYRFRSDRDEERES